LTAVADTTSKKFILHCQASFCAKNDLLFSRTIISASHCSTSGRGSLLLARFKTKMDLALLLCRLGRIKPMQFALKATAKLN